MTEREEMHIRLIFSASKERLIEDILDALRRGERDTNVADPTRLVLEEILETAVPGSHPWAVIPQHLMENARAALAGQK